ncbi:helix-turn-helix domain-containing protein [Paenibacillus doosanensis]|uniref:Arabinose operon regulatory protein n=1 Tax=Paenibacillus konkukensis TaxID=2020716 RepID=A0ABY4RNG8_9BACL|nr:MULTISPECIES: helix-turn-helix domain-containing protein [Paenibacillus]MCS7463535.1 helix-turn-helix domain-containing protein [Paenibacillus doosanensis]UQZ83381.1 Arabinose operon regulatory protein [Paenibacillus konkukensis]
MASFLHNTANENLTTVPGILISDHYIRPSGYMVKRSKGTQDFYLTYTVSGKGIFHNGVESKECGEGEITIITPGTPHYYGTKEQETWQFYWCHFMPKEEWASLLLLPEGIKGIKWLAVENASITARIASAFANLVQYSNESGPFSERLAVNALEEVLLLTAGSRAAEIRKIDPRVQEALDLLSQHYSRPFTVASLASEVSLSPSRFAHLFKKQTGESVMETLIKIRLRHAKKRLEHTSLSIAEIAAEVGFNNPFYFTRQFTSFFGCPPATFRRKMLALQPAAPSQTH